MNKQLINILGLLHEALLVGETIGTVVPGAQGTVPIEMIADKLVAIAQATLKAHQEITGQPLDLALLAPVEEK